jgi:dipeptidyl aminopeptidase/acylaminoacyl peptidase
MVSQELRLNDVQWDNDGRSLVWLEGRSDRGVLVTRTLGSPPRDLTIDENVRAWVGYGGGDFGVFQGELYFIEIDGRIFKRGLECGIPRPITPAFGKTASPKLSPDGRWILFVYSDGQEDLLGLVDAEGTEWPIQIARGADFYMQPAWHPDGKLIAWVEWDHPNMPWDETRIKLGKLEGNPPRLVEENLIASHKDMPSVEPLFSPDGRWLSYITANGEWENLVLMNLESGEKNVLVWGDQFILASPAWAQGRRSYGWSHSSKKLFSIRNFAGKATLWEINIEDGQSKQIDTTPYTVLTQLSVSPADDQVAFIAAAPSIPPRIVSWDGQKLNVVALSSMENIPMEFLPSPQEVTFPAQDGMIVYAHYYPPANPHFSGTGLPPGLVLVHGGPTGETPITYNSRRNYFTSRGYAFLELNYRGSSGYGRIYQRSMRGRWGEVDTEDAGLAAKALSDQKLADGNRLAILGGSAGGYLVLNTLVHHPGVYKAGINLFGVSNLFNLAMDTHKFESRYLDSMVGPLPEDSQKYHDWSAIYHADRISDPIAIFQGAIDPVVPPDQSEDIVTVLQRNNVPHIYKKYEGEGHGFRKTESNIDFLEQTERFLRQHVLFSN